MIVIPAVDIQGGRCVRLVQGLEDSTVVYGEDPAAMALHWRDEGAELLHVVDLDGAFRGASRNFEAVRAICDRLDIPVELGGGLRDADAVRRALGAGVSRAILGTAALDAELVDGLMAEHGPESVVVGIDARDGMVATRGWVETSEMPALDLARRLEDQGVRTIIYTDIARDGALKGPNLEALAAMAQAVELSVVASGGVSRLEDVAAVAALAELGAHNIVGLIVGKALYEGRFTLPQAIDAANRGE